MQFSERAYADLMFHATQKYASWDPEIIMRVGDWGRITKGSQGLAFWRKNGTFVREGNIYSDGLAEEYGIPTPVEFGGGSEWITSQNAQRVDLSASADGMHPALAKCTIKGTFKFSSGCGAILAMEDTRITIIDPPGALKRLLEDPSMRDVVVVSEVHSCSSYARLITAEAGSTVSLGLRVEPPIPGVASASATATWVRDVTSGNFKSGANMEGERSFYPLFRLVSLSERDMSTGL
ncbi:hypothetical protein B0H13DRAFT_1520832, partial [Mycena leptocephala]